MPKKRHSGDEAGSNFDRTRGKKGSNFDGGRGRGDFPHNNGNQGSKDGGGNVVSGTDTSPSGSSTVTSSGSFLPTSSASVVPTSSLALPSASISENPSTNTPGMLSSSQTATAVSSSSIPTATIIAISVLLSFIATTFAILLFFYLKWRRRRRSSTAEQRPPPKNSNTIYPFAMVTPQMERKNPGQRNVALSFVDTSIPYTLREQYLEAELRATRERPVDLESLHTLPTLPISPAATHVSTPRRILCLISTRSSTKTESTDRVSWLGASKERAGMSVTPIREVPPQIPPGIAAWDVSDRHSPVYSS
ncbi:hypothetical protein MVEN_01281100 [Mycena venus]|uniref:Uncharacterized protein n=1 Tax=Mycena venus TaxID=2733690 RepID=A0A8H7CTH7_9AGAR|nr:hypothetical protein MVEN_01281100 [Mycena venus]